MSLRHHSLHHSPAVRRRLQRTARPLAAMSVSTTVTPPAPAHQPLAGAEPGSFAEDTITKRLPAILESTRKDILQAPVAPGLRDEVSCSRIAEEMGRSTHLRCHNRMLQCTHQVL